jgi:glycine reductase
MRLQLDIVNIEDVQFSDQTTIIDRVLHINRQELQAFLKEDKRLKQVDIELAHPGEKCRIIQVTDVVEPRAKKNGEAWNGWSGEYLCAPWHFSSVE